MTVMHVLEAPAGETRRPVVRTSRVKPAVTSVAPGAASPWALPPTARAQTIEHTIPSGLTKVPELKAELGVPAEASLSVVREGGKPTQLVDHATHNVKAGDRFCTHTARGPCSAVRRALRRDHADLLQHARDVHQPPALRDLALRREAEDHVSAPLGVLVRGCQAHHRAGVRPTPDAAQRDPVALG